jgi:hypothetical protein
LPFDSIELKSGAKWHDLGRHSEYGKSTVRGQICLRMKLVKHNVKEDKGIARARRLGTFKKEKTTPLAVKKTINTTVKEAPSPTSTRSRNQKRNKKKKKIIHHKLDWSHVKSKTDSYHETGVGMDQEHLSRHEQLRMAQKEYRLQQHRNQNVIDEASFPVTHSIDLSMEDHQDDYYDNDNHYYDDDDAYYGNDQRGFHQGRYENEEIYRDDDIQQHDKDTLMKMYYHGEQTLTKLPNGRLGFEDLMELQSALESRDGSGGSRNVTNQNNSPLRDNVRDGKDEMTVLPHVLPHTLDFQDDDDTYEQNVRALEREYQRLGGAST